MGKASHTSLTSPPKIFILDTSVLLYDHRAWLNFAEHDVVIPIHVLEEVDHLKGGNEARNLEARMFIRALDQFTEGRNLDEWLPLPSPSTGFFKIVMHHGPLPLDAVQIFGNDKVDHLILNVVLSLQASYPKHSLILVTKDTCLRLKAQALKIKAQDYQTGRLKDVAHLYSGHYHYENQDIATLQSLKQGEEIMKALDGLPPTGAKPFITLTHSSENQYALYDREAEKLTPISFDAVFGVFPLNAEQAFALHALLDPSIQLVTIQGHAGTGKTLLALASALQQRKNFRQIYITRPVIPLSNREIGYLPGSAKSKTDPYLEPIWDNVRFLKDVWHKNGEMLKKIDDWIKEEKIAVTPLAFIRGRSLSKIFFIIDEAQNLTPHEVKTIISRAGEGTKIVLTGDIFQIDVPYMDAESNGLAYLIEHMKNQSLYAHITLQKGERSALANLVSLLP
jgi:PhoH-like ATPase